MKIKNESIKKRIMEFARLGTASIFADDSFHHPLDIYESMIYTHYKIDFDRKNFEHSLDKFLLNNYSDDLLKIKPEENKEITKVLVNYLASGLTLHDNFFHSMSESFINENYDNFYDCLFYSNIIFNLWLEDYDNDDIIINKLNEYFKIKMRGKKLEKLKKLISEI
jgi:hypothetical protein